MKHKSLFLMASLCGVTLLTAGCTTCPSGGYKHHEQGMHEKHQHQKHNRQGNAHAKMYTRSANGGNKEMGFVKFNETDEGMKMNVDLMYLRPGKTYTAQMYQCAPCDNSICCNAEAMSVDLPKIKSSNGERLQQSYIIQGLNADQLNNAQFILVRDGGYKAAWGTLNQ